MTLFFSYKSIYLVEYLVNLIYILLHGLFPNFTLTCNKKSVTLIFYLTIIKHTKTS